MKRSHLIGLGLLLLFGGFGASAFLKSLTPYVSFDEARRSKGEVQVVGTRVPGTDRYDEVQQALIFELADEQGNTLPVVYHKIKPGNFDQAPQVVVIGQFRQGALHSERMIVKCPSKYQAKQEAGEQAPH